MNRHLICKQSGNKRNLCICYKLDDHYRQNIQCIIKIQKFIKHILYKRLTKKQLVIRIFKPDKNGVSKWVTRETLSNTRLKLTNNGNARHGKFFNDTRFIWKKTTYKNKVIALRTNGYDDMNNNHINRRCIRKDIKSYHYKTGCVCCGSKNDLVIDHKNDLYNDPRVLDKDTQTIDDFQCLCQHCNLQKRQVCKYTIQNKKRYGATNIAQLKIFGVDFIEGDETLDLNDTQALKGTYWYDPVAFMKHIKSRMSCEFKNIYY